VLRSIYPIVEGHGEVKAVPVLLRRFAYEVHDNQEFYPFPPHRIPRGQIMAANQLEKAVELGARKVHQRGGGAILVLIDADSDCPAEIGPSILERVRKARPDVAASVVVAKAEYEAWFLASARSLRGKRNISSNAEPPSEPEKIRAAKEYVSQVLMVPGTTYSPTVDQSALTAVFDFAQARQCPSFDKLWRDLDRLFGL
jgi:hypothetical protein